LEEPVASIVIVTYNNLALTRKCVDSVLSAGGYVRIELVLVDNASTDQTPEYLRELEQTHPNVRVILNETNRGFSAANNQGLRAATGEYLVLLNNDTVVTDGWLRTMINHLRRDASIGILGPVTNNIGNEARIELDYGDLDQMRTAAARYTRRHAGETFDINVLAFFCVAFSRATFEQVGLLDEGFGLGFFEDDDYCQRIKQIGKRVVCAEDVFVHHELSASFNKLASQRKQELFEKNKAYYESKWGEWKPHVYRRRAA
jgi:GT2 family glycosyltransferase